MSTEKKLVISIDELTKKYDISLRELSSRSVIEINRIGYLASGKINKMNIEDIVRIAEALDVTDIREIIMIKNK